MHKFSVVIPAYNSAHDIEAAIASAWASHAEAVIVVDDGSSDSTAVKAGGLGCRVIVQENSGAAAARRVGLQEVATRYVVLLDADDRLVPRGVNDALKVLSSNENMVAVVGDTQGVSADGSTTLMRVWEEGVDVKSLLRRAISPGPPGAFVWITSSLRAALSDEGIKPLRPRYAEDYETIIRGAIRGEIGSVPVVTCLYAVEGGKSALAPMASNSSAEDIRRYYSALLNEPIRFRNRGELQSMAFLRQAYGTRGASGKAWLYLQAFSRSPLLAPRLFVARRQRRKNGSNH
ncbi:Glycosyl transferase family 2 [Agreia bicolorata]|uniref:Glycosyl transferase family 2 n=1 Tax=Agreia bicolorata TaxID=110935 RepID=A0A1T4X014_9MICO|nr:Glycosyl transferase family 2 [Agreia bicolorata]